MGTAEGGGGMKATGATEGTDVAGIGTGAVNG